MTAATYTVPENILRDIEELVSYSWGDEARDYEECVHDGNSQEGHIFLALERISDWLDRPEKPTRILY